MAAITKWNSYADWTTWVNADSVNGETRLLGNSLKLPFKKIETGQEDVDIARWRFGQFFGTATALQDKSGNNNHAIIPAGIPAEISENGLNCITKNGYATVTQVSDFSLDTSTYLCLACWVKSNILDYSDGKGLIAGLYNASGVVYGLIVDSDGLIKTEIYNGGSQTYNPESGEFAIDLSWHYVELWISDQNDVLIMRIDNEPASVILASPDDTPGADVFTIGSMVTDSSLGFSGLIDELCVFRASHNSPTTVINNLVPQYRFVQNVFLSPTIDTGRNGSILSGVLADFEVPNGSSVEFSFRASDTSFEQSDEDPPWSGFTAPLQVQTNTIADRESLGLFVRGRYQQARVRLSPSTDDLCTVTPVLNSLEINTAVSDKLLPASTPAFDPGTILAQVVGFDGEKNISKISLNLSVSSSDPKTFVVGHAGTISFQAANFTDSRDSWIFQPMIHWNPSNDWLTSGTTIQNSLQQDDYLSVVDAVTNAPYLTYRLFFPESGVYDLWGYGYTSGDGFYWSYDNDTTHLRKSTLGTDVSGWSNTPRWTKFGDIYLSEGGVHNFTVYLGELQTVILDQWYFTTNQRFSDNLNDLGDAGYSTPLPISKSHFNTAIRLRSLNAGSMDDLANPISGSTSVTSWLSSETIFASGKFNYEIRNREDVAGTVFENGVSIEYWQIGGGKDFFASWDFYKTSDSVGEQFITKDYGKTGFTQ